MAQVARIKSGGGGPTGRRVIQDTAKTESNEEVVIISELGADGRPRKAMPEKVLPGNERGQKQQEDTRLKKGERRERFFGDGAFLCINEDS